MIKSVLNKLIIFVVNILSVCIIFMLFETGYRIYLTNSFDFNRIFLPSISAEEYITRLLNKEHIPYTSTGHFRPDIKGNKQGTLLLTGCSFAWGDGLKEDETLSYKMSKLTNMTVCNRSGKGWGLDHLLYMSGRDDFYNNMNEPEYLIYIFQTRHLYRLDKFKMMPVCRDFQPKYNNKEGILIQQEPKLWHKSWLTEQYMWNYRDVYNPYKSTNQMFDVMFPYFMQSKTEFKKHCQNTKFVILKYPTDLDNELYNTERWKELEKEGFIVINADDLTDEPLYDNKYKCDGWHPNSAAWNLIAKPLAEKLELLN